MTTPTIRALVTTAGLLRFPPGERRALDMWLATLAGKWVNVFVEEESQRRSRKANAYYWSQVLGEVERANVGYTAAEFHDLMCERFLARKQFEVVNPHTGEVEVHDVALRSSKQSRSDFFRFVEQVRQFVAEYFGIETSDPDPSYWRKRKAA